MNMPHNHLTQRSILVGCYVPTYRIEFEMFQHHTVFLPFGSSIYFTNYRFQHKTHLHQFTMGTFHFKIFHQNINIDRTVFDTATNVFSASKIIIIMLKISKLPDGWLVNMFSAKATFFSFICFRALALNCFIQMKFHPYHRHIYKHLELLTCIDSDDDGYSVRWCQTDSSSFKAQDCLLLLLLYMLIIDGLCFFWNTTIQTHFCKL